MTYNYTIPVKTWAIEQCNINSTLVIQTMNQINKDLWFKNYIFVYAVVCLYLLWKIEKRIIKPMLKRKQNKNLDYGFFVILTIVELYVVIWALMLIFTFHNLKHWVVI